MVLKLDDNQLHMIWEEVERRSGVQTMKVGESDEGGSECRV